MTELTLENIIDEIFYGIEKSNKQSGTASIPDSENLGSFYSKKYGLEITSLPELFEILENSHKIFSFSLVKADKSKNIPEIIGYIISDLVIIKSLVGYYEKQLIRIYSEEVNENLPVGKIKKLFPSISSKYNNTELGKVGQIVLNLNNYEEILTRDYAYARDARQYSPEWKEKMLKKILINNPPIDHYIKEKDDLTFENDEGQKKKDTTKTYDKIRIKKEDTSKATQESAIEKNLLLYGIDLYTRICFRDYKFSIIQKVIDSNLIKTRDDFLSIKNHLKLLRKNSDKDLQLQKFAADINKLEKSVNEKLK